MVGVPITPSPGRGRGNGPETRPGIEPSRRGDVIPNLPALAARHSWRGGGQMVIYGSFGLRKRVFVKRYPGTSLGFEVLVS
jgi:hypothetical protein